MKTANEKSCNDKKSPNFIFYSPNYYNKAHKNMLIRKKVLILQQNLQFVNKRWQKEELGCALHQVPQGLCT